MALKDWLATLDISEGVPDTFMDDIAREYDADFESLSAANDASRAELEAQLAEHSASANSAIAEVENLRGQLEAAQAHNLQLLTEGSGDSEHVEEVEEDEEPLIDDDPAASKFFTDL